VWVTLEEISAIARFLNLSEAAFAQTFLRYIGDRVSLIEYDNGDCAMYDRGCKVYPVRPRQCQSFPFWQSNLSSPMAWERLKERCPGVGKGRLHTYREILAWL
jgi:Fe-S-cluster containining protein